MTLFYTIVKRRDECSGWGQKGGNGNVSKHPEMSIESQCKGTSNRMSDGVEADGWGEDPIETRSSDTFCPRWRTKGLVIVFRCVEFYWLYENDLRILILQVEVCWSILRPYCPWESRSNWYNFEPGCYTWRANCQFTRIRWWQGADDIRHRRHNKVLSTSQYSTCLPSTRTAVPRLHYLYRVPGTWYKDLWTCMNICMYSKNSSPYVYISYIRLWAFMYDTVSHANYRNFNSPREDVLFIHK